MSAGGDVSGGAERTLVHALSLLIGSPHDPEQILLVRRPPDDPDLPDVWGLPAGSLRPGESWQEAIRRAGREKLGVELEPGAEVNRGSKERSAYTLSMRLFEARISDGVPSVPQPFPEVTQYSAWRWGEIAELRPAADRGSLCSRLALEGRRAPGIGAAPAKGAARARRRAAE